MYNAVLRACRVKWGTSSATRRLTGQQQSKTMASGKLSKEKRCTVRVRCTLGACRSPLMAVKGAVAFRWLPLLLSVSHQETSPVGSDVYNLCVAPGGGTYERPAIPLWQQGGENMWLSQEKRHSLPVPYGLERHLSNSVQKDRRGAGHNHHFHCNSIGVLRPCTACRCWYVHFAEGHRPGDCCWL